jgi:hypothetical protein
MPEAVRIKKVSLKKANEIIETRKPIGMFYAILPRKHKKMYIGIDNRTGDAWTEDFYLLPMCKVWLKMSR